MTKLNRLLIPAAQFKAECLQLMNTVQEQHVSYIITKRGKPVAKLVPIIEEPINYFGCLKDTAVAQDDIVASLDIEWDADK
jgi:prevent-host-death family protein